MNPRAQRWIAVLGATIVALVTFGLLSAGHSSSGATRPARAVARQRTPVVYSSARSSPGARSSTTASTATPLTTAATPTTVPTASRSVALSAPITSSSVDWVEHKVTMTYDGIGRGYLLFRPAQVQTSRIPVVVELAGCCVSASVEANRADFRHIAGPAILVYPEYYEENWDAGSCCGTPASQGIDDVGFLSAVITQVRSRQPDAAPGPVYLAGYSNGAKMAMEMACRQPDLFAAVAVYGATRTSPCNGPPAASVLLMSGTADPEVAVGPGPPVVQNGFTEPTVNQLVASYLAADQCSGTRQTMSKGTALIGRWATCGSGRQVGEVLYQGANHDWPGGSGVTPSAQQLMWDFFSDLGA